MRDHHDIPLCQYRYDPLNRLVSLQSSGSNIQHFYLKARLTTETSETATHSILQHDRHPLAVQERQNGTTKSKLLATDKQCSVLTAVDSTPISLFNYTAYGHRPQAAALLSLLAFNGARPDPVTGHYLLGNGYRAFNPALMRFNSPDNWSPFGKGGLNAYAYCTGDPVNRIDPSGHFDILHSLRSLGKGFLNALHLRAPRIVRHAAANGVSPRSATTVAEVLSRPTSIDAVSQFSTPRSSIASIDALSIDTASGLPSPRGSVASFEELPPETYNVTRPSDAPPNYSDVAPPHYIDVNPFPYTETRRAPITGAMHDEIIMIGDTRRYKHDSYFNRLNEKQAAIRRAQY